MVEYSRSLMFAWMSSSFRRSSLVWGFHIQSVASLVLSSMSIPPLLSRMAALMVTIRSSVLHMELMALVSLSVIDVLVSSGVWSDSPGEGSMSTCLFLTSAWVSAF